MKRIESLLCLWLIAVLSFGQFIPVAVNNTAIYDFLDELENEGIITLNSAIKPYSRALVADKLLEAWDSDVKMSARMEAELEYYINAYRLETGNNKKVHGDIDFVRKNDKSAFSINPPGYSYKDEKGFIALKPIFGAEGFSNANGMEYTHYQGITGFGALGHWGFYSTLVDNKESVIMSDYPFLVNRHGGVYKRGPNEFEDVRGGITYDNGWLAMGIVKDFVQWGDNYNGAAIISDRAPAFGHLFIKLQPWTWFEFNYIHGWLSSGVVDSSQSYMQADGEYRDIYANKFIASNMFTFHPVKGLDFSVGNSLIYDGILNPTYLIPFLFYKSADHVYNNMYVPGKGSGQNAQLFTSVSYKGIKHLNLYASGYVDEFRSSRIGNDTLHNYWNLKAGFRLSNWPVKNMAVTAEYTKTTPNTYRHYVPTTTYESNFYNLGHYLKDNADERFVSVSYAPVKNLHLLVSYAHARRGKDYGYNTLSDVENEKRPFMDEVRWYNKSIAFKARYQLFYDVFLFGSVVRSEVGGADAKLYTPKYFLGKTTTFSGGFNVGF